LGKKKKEIVKFKEKNLIAVRKCRTTGFPCRTLRQTDAEYAVRLREMKRRGIEETGILKKRSKGSHRHLKGKKSAGRDGNPRGEESGATKIKKIKRARGQKDRRYRCSHPVKTQLRVAPRENRVLRRHRGKEEGGRDQKT